MKDRNALIGTIVGCTATLLVAIGGMWISTNNSVDAVELRLREEIRIEVGRLDDRVGRLDDRVGSLEIRITTRLDRLEDQVDETNERLSRIDERLSRIEGFLQRELEFVSGGDDE